MLPSCTYNTYSLLFVFTTYLINLFITLDNKSRALCITCCAGSVALLGLSTGSSRVYRWSLGTGGASHPVLCTYEDWMVKFRVRRWGEAVAALMTSCIDIASVNGEDLKTMDSETPGGETKRQAGRQIPLVPCVIAHHGSSFKENAFRYLCRGCKCLNSRARGWNVGFCCVL